MTGPPPPTPSEISVFLEDGRYTFRVAESQAIYNYDLDTPDTSNCDRECVQTWRPVAPLDGADRIGAWNIIERTDGSKQWTYKKRPVYTFAPDVPGKALGDGTAGLWHVVIP